MRLHFLGGADEVGASCLVVEAGGRRVLVDAGVRLNAPDPLPDLSRLQDLGGVDAVVVTHAHADHVGALPLAAAGFPAAPVLATPPTAALMAVMLEDTVRIGETRADSGGDLPAYGQPQVAALLERVRPLPFGQPLPLFAAEGETSWHLTFFPAGHVLGAAMALLETPEGTVLVSGDVSIVPQATVGPAVPPRRPVDVLVLESTYGQRLHTQRAAEEARLVAQIQEILARGGHCLIPAFALGRAQEVLLILAAARRRGQVGEVPVWVDGLVRSVCGVYQAYAESGSFALRRLVEHQGNPFFSSDGPARAVQRPEEREAVVAGPPAVIVSSSGMLLGGPSAFYAAKLAGDERNGILITGYQDEEAPGRRLLDLAQAEAARERRLILEGTEVIVRCTVARYNLSAHADGDELAALAERLSPGLTLLVHGGEEARQALAEKLAQRNRPCRLPALGDTVDLAPRGDRRLARQTPRPDPTPDQLAGLARAAGPGRGWTALELAERYYGEVTAAGVRAVQEILTSSGAFVPDRFRPMVYRLAPATSGPGTPAATEGASSGPATQARVQRRIDEVFGGDPTFVRASLYPADQRVELHFHFPDVALVRYTETLAQLEAETGWRVGLRPTPDQGALQAAVRRHLPAALRPLATPSLRVPSRTVEVRVEGIVPPEELAAATAAYAAETGYRLVVRGPAAADSADAAPSPPAPEATALPAPAPASAPADGVLPLEINAAFATIRESLAADGATVYKVAKRGEGIEVAFLTPAVGRRWRANLDALAASLGWPITIATQPQQGALIDLVRQVVTSRIARGPGIHVAEERIQIRLAPEEQPTPEQVESWRQAIEAQSGYRLDVEQAR